MQLLFTEVERLCREQVAGGVEFGVFSLSSNLELLVPEDLEVLHLGHLEVIFRSMIQIQAYGPYLQLLGHFPHLGAVGKFEIVAF